MGIQERRTRERDERKSLITQYAKELILERGVEAVSMQDIAQKAELSKATLYLYFPSKEAIFEQMFNEAVAYFCEYVEPKLNAATSGIDAIRAIWMSYIEIFGSSQDIFVMFGLKNYFAPGFPFVAGSPERGDPPGPEMVNRLIARVLERGVTDGTLDPSIDPIKIAKTILVIGSGIIDIVARLPSNMRDSTLIISEMKSTFEILLRGLAAPGTSRDMLTLPVRATKE